MSKEKEKITKKEPVKTKEKKQSLWAKFMIFCHGVKSETKKVHWPTKNDMIKYSVATVVFILFCSIFFYAIDVIYAFIQTIFK